MVSLSWKRPVVVAVITLGTSVSIPSLADNSKAPLRIVDGDSINFGKERHRLQGIDAPETLQTCQRLDGTPWKCGEAATEALKRKIGTDPVTCESNGRDRYKRYLSVCHAGGINLNRWMVSQGWAVAYRIYVPWYITEEESAQRDRLGLWSGSFVMPWDWRRGKRLVPNPLTEKRKPKPRQTPADWQGQIKEVLKERR